MGTSEHIQKATVEKICHIVDAAYSQVKKHKRLDQYDAIERRSACHKQVSQRSLAAQYAAITVAQLASELTGARRMRSG